MNVRERAVEASKERIADHLSASSRAALQKLSGDPQMVQRIFELQSTYWDGKATITVDQAADLLIAEQLAEAFEQPPDGSVNLPSAFINGSGKIQNIVEHACGGVAVIESIKATVRANHWHRTDWHYLYVLTGKLAYFSRPLGAKDKARDPVICGPGSLVFTPPRVEHAVYFPTETLCLSISRLNRRHEVHEADVVRLTEGLIDPEWMKEHRAR